MDAANVNRLRALICALAAEGLRPTEVGRRLGCSRTTVYKALKAPGPDRRSRRGRGALPAVEAARALALSGRPWVAGPADAGSGSAGAANERVDGDESGLYGAVAGEKYARAARVGPGLASEVAYARVLLCDVLKELCGQAVGPAAKHQLRADAARLLVTLARLQRAPGPGTGAGPDPRLGWLIELAGELREKNGAGARSVSRASVRGR